jgi:release factor glutamine methyltransferase
MNEAFTAKGLDSPRLSAEMLLSHVIGCDRLRLYTESDRPASPLERQALRDLVARALKNEPIQYLIGDAWFFGLAFTVDSRVLIPRPCTESIVERVLQHARSRPGFGGSDGDALLIADVCTGSGCIAVALAKHLPHARVIATDISEDALEIARVNAERHSVNDRIDFRPGDLLAPLLAHPAAGQKGALSFLVSNPPYIPDSEWESGMGPNVRGHEPEIALRGGPDGLEFIEPLINDGPHLLRPDGLLIIEIASVSAEIVRTAAQQSPLLENVEVIADLEGHPRTLIAARTHATPSAPATI